jgi:hypothetical protein
MIRTTVFLGFLGVVTAALSGCGAQDSASEGQTAEALGNDKVQPSDALDSAIVDAVLQRYSKRLAPAAAKTLPAAIVCGGATIDALATQNLTTDDAGTEILLDQTDGDQVGGLFFFKADLEALAAGKSARIPIKSYSGYWWSDGSHYRFANGSCRLK